MALYAVALFFFLWLCYITGIEFVKNLPLCHFLLTCSEGLGEAYDGDIGFASALETFGGGHNDPISLAFGGNFIGNYVYKLS